MAHQIFLRPNFVEIVHTGDVGYADRVSAMAAPRAAAVSDDLPILINFLKASVVDDDSAAARTIGRVDYMARAIVEEAFQRRSVAMVGISVFKAKPAATAALVRGLPFQVFERRDQAVAWLIAQRKS